ncbi:MAG: response regulator, partial [Chloroflexi bacterium]|nr:response regulator [Chloroflexota bacterium]
MDILVVDDDRDIADIIGYSLRKEGHRPILAHSGEEALVLAERSRPDLVVLDVMLPGMSGFDVCRKLREGGPIPVILLTARGEEADRVWGLDLGADDYVTKPFSHRELLARIRAVARRAATAQTPDHGSVAIAELSIDFDRRLVMMGARPVELT